MTITGPRGARAGDEDQPKAAEDCRTPRRWRDISHPAGGPQGSRADRHTAREGARPTRMDRPARRSGPARMMGAIASALLLLASSHAPAATVKASRGEITLPTYPWAAVETPLFPGHGQGEHLSLPDARFPEPRQNQPHLPDGRPGERIPAHHLPAGAGRQDPRGHRQNHRPADVLRQPRDQARADRPVRGLDQRRRGVEHRPARPHRRLHAAGGGGNPAPRQGRLALGGHRRDRAHLRHQMDRGGHAPARALVHRGTHPHLQPHRVLSAPTISGTAPPCRTRPASASSTR